MSTLQWPASLGHTHVKHLFSDWGVGIAQLAVGSLSLSLPCVVSCFVLTCMLSTVWRPACHDMPFVHFSGWGVAIAFRHSCWGVFSGWGVGIAGMHLSSGRGVG